MLRTPLAIFGIVALSLPQAARAQTDTADDPASALKSSKTGALTRDLQPPLIFEPIEGLDRGITDCLQDDTGFIWVSLESGGMMRYDGAEARAYRRSPNDESQLQGSYLTKLAMGPNGRLWIGTGDSGVSVLKLNTDQFTHYRADDKDDSSLSSNGVNVLMVDSRNTVWVGTSDGVLNRFDPATKSFSHVRIFDEAVTEILAVAEDRENKFWVGTRSEGLFRIDPDSGRVIERRKNDDSTGSIHGSIIRALLVDDDNILWVGTENGLDRLNLAAKDYRRFTHKRRDRTTLADNNVGMLFQDSDGTLWVGTEGGLHELSDDGRSFTRFAQDPDVAGVAANNHFPSRVVCGFQDKGGVLHFGDYTTSLLKVTPGRRSFRPYDFFASALVNGPPGVIWGGTFGRGPVKVDFNEQTITWYPTLGDPDSPDSIRLRNWVGAVHLDKNGHVWLGGQGFGLIDFDPETGAYQQFLNTEDQIEGITANDIQDIIGAPDGSIWLATLGGGINRYYPDGSVFQDFSSDPDDDTSLSSDYVHTIRFDRKSFKHMWVGTAGGGLNRFDLHNEKFIRYSLLPEGSKDQGYDIVLCIYQDSDDILWVGTGAGLVRFDPASKSATHFDTDFLAQRSVYGILPGADGELWMSTNGGGLVRYEAKAPEGQRFTQYGRSDGLMDAMFVQNAYARMPDGDLLFNGGLFVHRFNPKNIKPDEFKPPVALTGFKLFDKEVDFGQPIWTQPSIDLDYTQSVISFEFAALSFAAPARNKYRYKMDGMHGWIETQQRFVTYPNIEFGDYVFRVQAASEQGAWSEEGIAVSVKMSPPPWRTWWAYAIYVLILLGLVWLFLRYQARKVQALRDAHRLESVEADLALTGAVQTGFLPVSDCLETDWFSLQGFYRPADRASGDWWWYEEEGDNMLLLIGDVTGHGAGPAMVTAAAATAFRIQENVPLAPRLTTLNREVQRVGAGTYHMTMSALEVDRRTGHFVYHSAGGLPLMRSPKDGKTRLMPCPGTPLGSEQFRLGQVEGTMVPGEQLMLYTDGIPELELANGRLLGMRRFCGMVEKTRGHSVAQAAEHIVQTADALREGRPQDDDWTFALIKWKGTSTSA